MMARARVVLHTNAYWRLEHQVIANIIVLTRSRASIDELQGFLSSTDEVVQKMRANRDVRGLLVDMRLAHSRNDAEYENGTAGLRREIYAFKRVAMLFGTAAGALQVKRLGGNNDTPTLATTDESAALEFASVRHSLLPPASSVRRSGTEGLGGTSAPPTGAPSLAQLAEAVGGYKR